MTRQQPVAIVGMAAFLPGARSLEAYWHNLLEGVDAVGEVPDGRWDLDFYAPGGAPGGPGAGRPGAIYCRRGGFVDDLVELDPAAFGIMPQSVSAAEPDQLIALRVAADAIADAGGRARLPADRSRVGIVLGRGGYLTPGLARLDQRLRTAGQLTRTLRELLPELDEDRIADIHTAFTRALGPDGPDSVIGLVPNFAASRVANRLDLRGPAYTVDAACASSLIAVDQAVAELSSGRCDLMLAGGVHHCHDITLWSVFAQLRALSPSQRIRPFHREADGVLMGEGTGVVALKRLADAERDGDRIYAVVRGTGVAGDGRAASLVSPDPGGQERAVRQAWRAAGLDPGEPGALGLLEAHGTGMPNGDAAELATVAAVFGADGPPAVIGSVKSMIGHTMPAAGIAGLIKAALAVHYRVLLPTLHCQDPHPALDATRFRPLAAARPWETGPGCPVRRAGVNAFGFGGINAHVLLEEPLRRATRRPTAAPEPVPVSVSDADGPRARVTEPEAVLRFAARTPEELAELLEADDGKLRAVCAGGAVHGPGGPARLATAEPTAKRLALARTAAVRGTVWGGRGEVWFAPHPLLGSGGSDQGGSRSGGGGGGHGGGSDRGVGRPRGGGKVAFVFPGLEAEFAPRVDDVADHFGLTRPKWQNAAVADVARHGAAVFGVGRLLAGALRRTGIEPDVVVGHSVGEWTAMAEGGIYRDEEVNAFLETFAPDALRVPGLAFATLGAPAGRVQRLLADGTRWEGITLSHDNAPHQSVVCGPADRVRDFVAALRDRGVLGRVLPFESGFHTPMLAPLLGPIAERFGRFTLHRPSVPVWSGTTAAPFPDDPAAVRELVTRHLLEPVRFRQLTESLYAAGVRTFVQVGPGQLGSLIDDTLAGRQHLTVTANSPRRTGLAQLRRAAIALWAFGAEPDIGVLLRRPGAVSAPAQQAGARPVRLALGAPLVSLDPATRDRLGGVLRDATRRAAPAAAAAPTPGSAARGSAPGGSAALDALAERFPAAAELSALMTETAETVAALAAATRRGPVPAPARSVSSGPPVSAPAAVVPRPSGRVRRTLRVSVTDMPYLLDHCFFRQRPGWPETADRRPVVPATTIVQHMVDTVEKAAPGRPVVAVHDMHFSEWVVAAPALDVTVEAVPEGEGRFSVSFGRYARAAVETAAGACARTPAAGPVPWPVGPGERRPEVSARQMYEERWMFHGPLFRAVEEITGLGERHVRGRLVTPAAPGALLDNVGQLLGYWLMATHTHRTVVFPAAIRELRFHGPHPAPGTALTCLVRITELTDTVLAADAQLVLGDGTVWAEIRGWRDRRFDSCPEDEGITRRPERASASQRQPGGWQLMFDRWPDPASRELRMHSLLGSDERAEYERRPPRGKRQWLLGRFAAKDAVRRLLWEAAATDGGGTEQIFPAEIRIRNDKAGRPWAEGVHGRELPALSLSLAHCREAAVALARPPGDGPGPGVGIDIEEITPRPPGTLDAALGPAERHLLARCTAANGDTTGEAAWFTRFWAAKEAAAKAEGTGLRGRPREFGVIAADAGELLVRAPADLGHRRYRVRCAQVANPPGLPDREYIVAWTAPPAHTAPPEHTKDAPA